nr:peptidoglycan recognition protein 1 [Tegillarca granosa]
MWTRAILLCLFCIIDGCYGCFCPNKNIHLGCVCARPNQTLEIEQHPTETEIKSGQCFQIINYAFFKNHDWAHIIYMYHNAFVKMIPVMYEKQPCGNFTTTPLPTTQLTTKTPFTCSNFHIVSHNEWGASSDFLNQPEMSTSFTNLPQFAIIHHTDGKSCLTSSECKARIQQDIQHWKLHQFNFAVGEDGNVYELNGWNHLGKHAGFYNQMSIGIAFIGNFQDKPPNQKALDAAEHLLQCGLQNKLIDANYVLRAIRDLNGNTSPGDALYEIVTKMAHY